MAEKKQYPVGGVSHQMGAAINHESQGQTQPSKDEDFYAWVLNQVLLLRAQHSELDRAGLAEELEEIALRIKNELISNLEIVFVHLLKLQYELDEYERTTRARQWKLHLIEHRNRINDALTESRTLLNQFELFKAKAYPRACKAVLVELEDRIGPFPPEPQWTDAQILDDDFFPDPTAA